MRAKKHQKQAKRSKKKRASGNTNSITRTTQHYIEHSYTTKEYINKVEDEFKKICNMKDDIGSYPLHSSLDTSVATNKSKSKQFGEVFTPLWLVDEMLGKTNIDQNTTTLDLCAGYGQFSIRLLRRLYKQHKAAFHYARYLKNKHSFVELQLSSCYKLLRIFGTAINLFIGDAKELPRLPGLAHGIWCYVEALNGWVPIDATVKNLFKKFATDETEFTTNLQNIINNLNETYKEMNTKVLNIRYDANTRLNALQLFNDALNKLHAEKKDDSTHTPQSVVNDMLAQVADLDKKQILVLFNAELVEGLIHSKKVSPKNIVFGVDEVDKARALFAQKMYGVDTCVFADKNPKSILKALGNKRWDLVLSNPPYNRGLDLKILMALMEAKVAREYVIVHPSRWIIDRKGNALYDSMKEVAENKLKSVKLFNGNPVFGIDLFIPCIITHIDTNHNSSDIEVEYFDKKFSSKSIHDITKFGTEWNVIVKPFFHKMEDVVKQYGDVWSHNEKSIDQNKVYCQLAAMMGHHGKDKSRLTEDDFYTLTIRNSTDNRGIRQPRLNKPGNPTPTFGFKTEVERNNFLDYLNTDFARFCLALLKNNSDTSVGQMVLIPWLDFTEAWDDEKLFAHFGIDQKTQDYIRSFLPDYYGIRKNNKSNAA